MKVCQRPLFAFKIEAVKDRPTIGFLQLGTGNSFLRDVRFQQPRGFGGHGIETLIGGAGKPRACDCDTAAAPHRRSSFTINTVEGMGAHG